MAELPYPNLLARTDEEKIEELVRYLIQFRERLEFILSDIGTDNLSPELATKIASINGISVQDVVESPIFTEAVKSIISKTYGGTNI